MNDTQITWFILQFRVILRNLSSSFAQTRLCFTSVREIRQSQHMRVLIKGIHTFTKVHLTLLLHQAWSIRSRCTAAYKAYCAIILHFILQSRQHAGARAEVLLLSNWASQAGMYTSICTTSLASVLSPLAIKRWNLALCLSAYHLRHLPSHLSFSPLCFVVKKCP